MKQQGEPRRLRVLAKVREIILSRLAEAEKDFTERKKYPRGDSNTGFIGPVLLAKFPKCLQSDSLRLRPLGVFDIPSLKEGLRDRDILNGRGVYRPVSGLSLSLWWWFKRTYDLLFGIEVDGTCIGFVGLYNLSLSESAEMSLVIVDSGMRRRGCGTMTFTLLAQALRRYSLVEKILVRVKTDNHAALSFWKTLGFEESDSSHGIRTMSLQVTSIHMP